MVNTQIFEWSSVKETSFDLKAYLSERRSQIEAALEQSITVVYPEILYESMRYSLLAGGKRLRPILFTQILTKRKDMPTNSNLKTGFLLLVLIRQIFSSR